MVELKILETNNSLKSKSTKMAIKKRDLLYPFAIVLMMLSFFNLAGTLSIFSVGILVLGEFFKLNDEGSTIINLVINLIAQAGAILIFTILHKMEKIEPEERIMPPGNNLVILYLAYALEIVYIVTIIPLMDKILEPLGPNISSYETILPTPELLKIPIYYILFFGVLIFGAAIAEELIFRRTLIPLLERRGLGTFWVLFISSLMFSLIHTPADLDQGTIRFTMLHFLGTFAGGITLGFIYLRTRKVIYPMIMHGLSNGFAALSSIAITSNDELILALASVWLLISLLVGIFTAIAVLFQFFQSIITRKRPVWLRIITDIKSNNLNLLLIFGFTICFVLIEGGVDVLLSNLINIFFPVSLERTLIESIIKLFYLIGLIVLLGIIIFRLAKPLITPNFSLTSFLNDSSKDLLNQEKDTNNRCRNCGLERLPETKFCIYCGSPFDKE